MSVTALILVFFFFIAISLVLYMVPVGLWISALASGVPVGLFTLIGMRFRRVVPHAIILPLIQARKGAVKLTISELEAHYLSRGNVGRVVAALIAAQRARIPLDFKKAAAIDLAGRDVLKAVQMSVTPKVIQTPLVSAVAGDGIQVNAKARITVRANIERLVGGAGEDTVLARVGEGIVSSIGKASSHKSILENPDSISSLVLEKGLDSGTAYEILSIDIADVDVGKNIGAHLQANQAEADMKVAQAKAEGRRAMAVSREQEMLALQQEMRAKVVKAEADVPRAIASSLQGGKFGIMDYYEWKNLMADTRMRESISDMPASS